MVLAKPAFKSCIRFLSWRFLNFRSFLYWRQNLVPTPFWSLSLWFILVSLKFGLHKWCHCHVQWMRSSVRIDCKLAAVYYWFLGDSVVVTGQKAPGRSHLRINTFIIQHRYWLTVDVSYLVIGHHTSRWQKDGLEISCQWKPNFSFFFQVFSLCLVK